MLPAIAMALGVALFEELLFRCVLFRCVLFRCVLFRIVEEWLGS
jgi:membrane protease YdiL (CAAX protease family)